MCKGEISKSTGTFSGLPLALAVPCPWVTVTTVGPENQEPAPVTQQEPLLDVAVESQLHVQDNNTSCGWGQASCFKK